MPVGKFTPDGESVNNPRHSQRTLRALQTGPTIWDCPACGMKNEGRPPHQGCLHCGAGDQRKSVAGAATRAGQAERAGTPLEGSPGKPAAAGATGAGATVRSAGGASDPIVGPARDAAPTRILRLIEYLIRPGENVDTILRRSLVGRMDLPWGTITATIVDSSDGNQEDRLKLARMQPGVWMANPEAMEGYDRRVQPQAGRAVPTPMDPSTRRLMLTQLERTLKEYPMAGEAPPQDAAPPTGPSFTRLQGDMATALIQLLGPQMAHTICLGLSQIAEELEGNMEPEKFVTREEALQLANAILHHLPAWPEQPPSPPPGPVTEEQP